MSNISKAAKKARIAKIRADEITDEKDLSKAVENLIRREKMVEEKFYRVYKYQERADRQIRKAAGKAAESEGEAAVLRLRLEDIHDDYRDQMAGLRRKVKKQADEINRLRGIIEKGFTDAP